MNDQSQWFLCQNNSQYEWLSSVCTKQDTGNFLEFSCTAAAFCRAVVLYQRNNQLQWLMCQNDTWHQWSLVVCRQSVKSVRVTCSKWRHSTSKLSTQTSLNRCISHIFRGQGQLQINWVFLVSPTHLHTHSNGSDNGGNRLCTNTSAFDVLRSQKVVFDTRDVLQYFHW